MDSDAATLDNALAVLRRHLGEQLAGPSQRGEDQMRYTLKQELGLDERSAMQIIKNLRESGQLVYVGGTDAGTDTGTGEGTSDTGPVISMPNTQSADGGAPLITTASPAMVMGIVNDPNAGVERVVEEDTRMPTNREPGEAQRGNAGYWRIG